VTTGIQGVFEAALLKYIQIEVDQLAEGIRGWEQNTGSCYGHDYDDTCLCDTSTSISVDYRVPREINRFGYKTWRYDGNFFDLVNMLDRADTTEIAP
jgi:hypothetical protein